MRYSTKKKLRLLANKKEKDKKNGLRHAIFDGKGYYIGEWKNDKRNGKGKEVTRNGWIYEGDWVDNQKHGYGVLSKIQCESGIIKKIYAGSWYKNKKHGYGCHWYADCSYYEGTFRSNVRNNYGRIWYDDWSYYQGYWENDLYHGFGLLVQSNGNRFEGMFVKGKQEGKGYFFHLKTGQHQDGLWRNGTCIQSIIEDIEWRQSARFPTPYPIPKIKLKHLCPCIEKTTEIHISEK